MEYLYLGNLGTFWKEKPPVGEEVLGAMIAKVLQALSHLHKQSITHRDVKPQNILVNPADPFITKLPGLRVVRSDISIKDFVWHERISSS